MRTLALALLLAVSGSVAALAQQDPSYYSERAYQWRADHPNQAYDARRSDDRRAEDRRDAERWREQQAYERGRQEADRNQQNGQNDIVNSIGRMFNNR